MYVVKKLYDKIYQVSPVWFQNVVISVYGYLINKKRYGKTYHKWFDIYSKKEYTDYQAEVNNQEVEFLNFVNFAAHNSTFYKQLYEKIDLSDIRTMADLHKLPVVDKEMLRSQIDKFYTVAEKNAITSFTGGTTGKSLQVRFTKEDFQKRMAYLDAFKYRLRIDPFTVRKATFSGRSLVYSDDSKVFWRYNRVYKQRLYSTFHLTQENIPYYISDLNKFKPDVINGFVSAIYELAEFIKRNNITLTFTTKAIFTTSETLLPIHRVLIEEVFKCKIYDQYASAEGAPFITE